MLVDGRNIASEIKNALKQKVSILNQKEITPQLAVIFVGNDLGSTTYVRAKRKAGKNTGIKVTVYDKPMLQKDELVQLVQKLNHDSSIHGIIIQRPLPIQIEKSELDVLVSPRKDVDGFHPQTQLTPPVALAVDKILKWIAHDLCNNPFSPLKYTPCDHYLNWLKKQKILVIGRGETAGKPIAKYLLKKGAQVSIAHSKTGNLEKTCNFSSIIISCVGKSVVVRRSMINNKTILIGVGLHSEDGKLRTDYNPVEIKDTVAYYTPVPGGVGPVNVACLMENVVVAASMQNNK